MNVLMMMVANLIGFCVGLDGIADLLKGIIGSYSGMPPHYFSRDYLSARIDGRMGFNGGSICFVVCRCAGHVRDQRGRTKEGD